MEHIKSYSVFVEKVPFLASILSDSVQTTLILIANSAVANKVLINYNYCAEVPLSYGAKFCGAWNS